MSPTIRPARRFAVTLAMTAAAAFGAVAVAPAAFAADATAVAPVTDPAAAPAPATETAPVTGPSAVPPAVVYDKNGKPVKEPKVCTPKDLADSAAKVAAAAKKVAPQLALAAKSHAAADVVRGQEVAMTAAQVRVAEAVANGLDAIGNQLSASAQAVIDKAGALDCVVVSVPGGRF
jgi:hypothetical protein